MSLGHIQEIALNLQPSENIFKWDYWHKGFHLIISANFLYDGGSNAVLEKVQSRLVTYSIRVNPLSVLLIFFKLNLLEIITTSPS